MPNQHCHVKTYLTEDFDLFVHVYPAHVNLTGWNANAQKYFDLRKMPRSEAAEMIWKMRSRGIRLINQK